ncbi:MAG TPA: S8 family serine peptidase [Caldilineae bacterium]|nr:S8 family serine peptidase [Caldilineae bacterium]
MRKKLPTILGITLLVAMLIVAVAPVGAAPAAPSASDDLSATSQLSTTTLETNRNAERWPYIILLDGAPVATYKGGIAGLPATSPTATGETKLDASNASSIAYADYLAAQQDQFIASLQSIASSAEVVHTYQYTLNGVAAIMTADEAASVAKMPGVTAVLADKMRYPDTDVTPDFIGAVNVWDGSAAGVDVGTKGEGVIVGVVDTGIWPEHPSFADDGSYPAPPADWGGECTPPADGTADYTCTNKLIGVQYFLDTYVTVGGGYDGLFLSGRDDDGHGTHTASTSAGNEDVPVTLLGVDRGTVSGIAPRAHVAMYKALGPLGGYGSDLVAAIDKAVADGVDVINYSIGGGASNPWDDADSLAFLNARAAGVFVATSAGNSGPGPDTVGSPGNAPWIATVGASTSNRHFISDITLSGPGEAPTGLYGASITAGVTDFNLVDAEGIPDSTGDDSGLCLNPFNPGTFAATDVVLCKRGQIARVLRGDYVAAGGGGGVILYNPVQQGLATDNYIIPAVHVENDIGQQIKDYIVAHPGEVTVSFTQGMATYGPEDPRVIPDMMASFSSRGPNGPVMAVIKPDVTAPGVQILAGASPEHDGAGAQGELFQSIQGTSMSSPHVAGAGALLKAVHPDWSPAEIQSALMTTALTAVVKEDGVTPADPFDLGAGRIDLNKANDPGLVFDMTVDDYMVGEADPANMNLPSLGFGSIAGRATITRTATSLMDAESTWEVSVDAPDGVTVTVSPDPLVVPANSEATFTVSVDAVGVPEGLYFAHLYLSHGPHTIHMPIAFWNVPATWTSLTGLTTQFDKDMVPFELNSGVDVDPFMVNAAGLVDPVYFEGGPLVQDPDQDPDTDFCGEGQECWPFSTVGGELWWVFQVRNAEIADADLYLYHDANGDGEFTPDELIDSSTSGSSDEEVQAVMPAGDYLVQVQAWAGSGAYDLKVYDVGMKDLNASVAVTDAPAAISAGNDYMMKFAWDHTIDPGEEYLGVVALGSPDNPVAVGIEPVRIMGDAPAISKMADVDAVYPTQEIGYEIVLANNSDSEAALSLTDTLPANVTVDPDSITGDATLTDGVITWEGVLPPAANEVVIAPSDFPYGYFSLAGIGVPPLDGCTGCDEAAFNFTGDPVSYLGTAYETVCMVSNGYLVMGGCASTDDIQWQPQQFPNAAVPNNVIAPLWMDFDLDGGDGEGGGTWYAANLTDGVNNWRVFEWENAERWGEEGTAFTFQVWLKTDYEDISFTYGLLNGPMAGSSVGAENADASAGDNWYFNDGAGNEVGNAPTLDDILGVYGQAGAATHTITYMATATEAGEAMNEAVVNKGMAMDKASATVTVEEGVLEGAVTQTPSADPLVYGDTVDVDVNLHNFGADIADGSAILWLDAEVTYVDGSAYNATPLTAMQAADLLARLGLEAPTALSDATAAEDVIGILWEGALANTETTDFGFTGMVNNTTGSIMHAVNVFDGYMHVGTFVSDALEITETAMVELPLLADTWVSGGSTGANHDSTTHLTVRTSGLDNAFLTFDRSALPAGASIISAELTVKTTAQSGAFGKELTVLNTNPFDSTTVTYDDAPQIYNPSATVAVPDALGMVTFDVIGNVTAWDAAGAQATADQHIGQLAISATGPFGRIVFDSLETWQASPAKLVVTYFVE